MPSRPKPYICATCGKPFLSSNRKPEYCSRPCRDQNPARKQRLSVRYRQIPDRPCVICGKVFRPAQRTMNHGTPVECCSFACARLKARKHQREDITHCIGCGKALTKRQISNQNEFCSRGCFGISGRATDALLAMQTAGEPTSIERAMRGALDGAGVAYVFQFPIFSTLGLKRFVCDFVIPAAMLVVECDGDYWHSKPGAKSRDKRRDAYLRACGYTVLRFSETEIERDVAACVQSVLSRL
jgi:hypothetical protein